MSAASLMRTRLLIAVVCIAAAPHPSAAQAPPARVMSLNMCTDQLLLDLAPLERIVGLSPYAADVARSYFVGAVGSAPILSGTAEEVLALKPDLVVSSTFTKRETRAFIKAYGVPMEEFAPVESIAETKRQIARFGEILGAGSQAAERIAAIDAALAELKAAAAARPLRVLPLSRRGWVAGARSLMSDLIAEAGFVNAAGELGIAHGGQAGIERIVSLRPDAIIVSSEAGGAEDQGKALLLHPAIRELFPPDRRIVLPEKLTVCGGPMLADAMRVLAAQIGRLRPRDRDADPGGSRRWTP